MPQTAKATRKEVVTDVSVVLVLVALLAAMMFAISHGVAAPWSPIGKERAGVTSHEEPAAKANGVSA